MAVYFDNISFNIKNELRSSKESILICVAWIDFDIYQKNLIDALNRNVSVVIVVTRDKKIKKYEAEIAELINAGAIIEVIALKQIINCMHNKFCIIDRCKVISGSYNWTHNAKGNCENIEINERTSAQVAQYEYEADRIIQINRMGIDSILKFDKCPNCRNNMLNAIVINMDECCLIKICSNDTAHYINDGVCIDDEPIKILEYINGKFDHLVDSSGGLTEEEYQNHIEQERILYSIERDKLLNDYSHKVGFPIHAIGIATYSTDFIFEGEKYVKMIWYNKFAAEKLENEYFESFDIF